LGNTVISSIIISQNKLIRKYMLWRRVIEATKILPVRRQVGFLNLRYRQHFKGVVRIDTESPPCATLLGRISRAVKTAIRVRGLGSTVAEEVVTEALDAIFYSCDRIS
jgi:hypothetical protein